MAWFKEEKFEWFSDSAQALERETRADMDSSLSTRTAEQFSSLAPVNSAGLIKNLKTDSATIKSQFGSLGEEPSVAITKSAGDAQKSVEFPFNETKISVPTSIPDSITGMADKFGSMTAGMVGSVGSDIGKTVTGMFNSASTTMSSVVGGVGEGISSAIGGIKDTLAAASKQLGAITSTDSPEQKFALKTNPLASLEDQASTFKSYANKLEGETSPSLDQLKGQFGGLTNSLTGAVGGIISAGGSIIQGVGSRVQGLSTLFDKSPTVSTNATSASSIADVIKQTTGSIGGSLSNLSNSVSADVLAARTSRAQLFPVDALESKLQSVGDSLKPTVISIKDSVSSLLPSGADLSSVGTSLSSTQIADTATKIMASNPSLTQAQALDSAAKSLQLNASSVSTFGIKI